MKKPIDNDHFLESQLEQILRDEPNIKLSDDFADRVSNIVYRSYIWREYVNEFLINIGVLFSTVLISTIIFYFIGNDQLWKTVNLLIKNQQISLLALVILLFVLFVDKVLLQYFNFRRNFTKEKI